MGENVEYGKWCAGFYFAGILAGTMLAFFGAEELGARYELFWPEVLWQLEEACIPENSRILAVLIRRTIEAACVMALIRKNRWNVGGRIAAFLFGLQSAVQISCLSFCFGRALDCLLLWMPQLLFYIAAGWYAYEYGFHCMHVSRKQRHRMFAKGAAFWSMGIGSEIWLNPLLIHLCLCIVP